MKKDKIMAALLESGFHINTAKNIVNAVFHDAEEDVNGNMDYHYVQARSERLHNALTTLMHPDLLEESNDIGYLEPTGGYDGNMLIN